MTENALHVVVLAAGEGKRMNSDLPKVLQPVGGVPMLRHLLDSAIVLNPARVHVVVGHGADRVRELLESLGDERIATVEQRQRLGTGHAVQRAMGAVPDDARVLVLPGDMPLVRPATLARLTGHDTPLALLSFEAGDPAGYGRILRDADLRVVGIREQRDATPEELRIREVNSGVLVAHAGLLRDWLGRLDDHNAQHEYYLTDCVGIAAGDGVAVEALICPDPDELAGANTMRQLAELDAALQARRRGELMDVGVRMPSPDTVLIRGRVSVGRDVEIDHGVILEGDVTLGDGVRVGPGCVVRDSRLAAGTRLEPYCLLDGARTLGACTIGPFARLRPGTRLEENVRIGNFVETKNARFGPGAKANHLSYIGDATVGARTNLGAGTITCNYDGVNKYHSGIGEDAFIGSNSALVAPVEIGDGATVGAGSVVSGKVPGHQLTVARAKARSIPGWRRPTRKDEPE